MKPRILIIDSVESDAIAGCFSPDHYVMDVVNAGVLALDLFRVFRYECVVIGKPMDRSPSELLAQIRQSGLIMPILYISDKKSPVYKEEVFDSGADEFVISPFDAIEVAARIRALLRRSARYVGDVLTAQKLSVNTSTLRVFSDGSEVDLAPMEFNLLVFLMRNADRVFTADDLATNVWPDESQPTVEAIRTCVKSLRRKTNTGASLIRTAYGSGYYLDGKKPDFAPTTGRGQQVETGVCKGSGLQVVPVIEATHPSMRGCERM
ncbi:MAG: response regulator transcription factor [Candidatus Obscuribacterales bacterium]|nr:response regulator transcription factor [Candidatus Obscuribacterales bacterium]